MSALIFGAAQPSEAQTSFPSGCIGYCGSGIAIGMGVTAGAVAAVGIFLAVNHSRHFLTGCVVHGDQGPELRASDTNTYALEGDPSAIKVGERIKFHGSTMKRRKNGKGEKVFRVDHLKRDYGPCNATSTTAEVAPFRAASSSY